jgi:hypothetical protein
MIAPICDQAIKQKHTDTRGYCDIGKVERWPVKTKGVEVQKIGNCTIQRPVNGISKRPPDHKSKGASQPAGIRFRKPSNKKYRNKYRDPAQNDRRPGRPGAEKAEACPPVPDHHNIKKRRYLYHLWSRHDVVDNSVFSRLI